MERSSDEEGIAKFQLKLDQMKAELDSIQKEHWEPKQHQEQQQHASDIDLKQNQLLKTKNIILAEELSCKKMSLDFTQQNIWSKVETLSSKFKKDFNAVSFNYVEDMFCRDDDHDVAASQRENAKLKGEHEALILFREYQLRRINTAMQSLAKVQRNLNVAHHHIVSD